MRPATVDAIIIRKGKILLVKRRKEPFSGRWALPGGFVEENETAEEAVAREALEETGVKVRTARLLGVYSSPLRDPRRTIAIAFLCAPAGGKLRAGSDAGGTAWFPISKLPPLAFDHSRIVADAKTAIAPVVRKKIHSRKKQAGKKQGAH